jgi:hypothetical protein
MSNGSAHENQRTAIGISVTLSCQIIAAALAMIPVVCAFATFLADKRTPGAVFYWLVGLSIFLFVVSIFSGGRGVTAARNAGFNQNWTLREGKGWFNCQAITCFLGLLLFGLAVFWPANAKEEPIEKPLAAVVSKLDLLASKMAELAAQQKVDRGFVQSIQTLVMRLDAAESALKNYQGVVDGLQKGQEKHGDALVKLDNAVAELQKSQTELNTIVSDLRSQITSLRTKKTFGGTGAGTGQ